MAVSKIQIFGLSADALNDYECIGLGLASFKTRIFQAYCGCPHKEIRSSKCGCYLALFTIRFTMSALVTTIESHVNNYNARASEVTFRVTLPQPAFISRFSMLIDNVTYPGHVHEKEAATKQYEKAKDKGQSAGIIRQKPRDTNVFVVR